MDTIKINSGRIRKIVQTVTKYVPEEAPGIDINIEEHYTVEAPGVVEGVDRLNIKQSGKPVEYITGARKATLKEVIQAIKSAYSNVLKKGGIGYGTAEEINAKIEQYNSLLNQYNSFGGISFMKPISEEVLTTHQVASDLEGRL